MHGVNISAGCLSRHWFGQAALARMVLPEMPAARGGAEMRLELLMFDGIAEADILLANAVLMKARLAGADVDPVMVTADGREEIIGCYGTRIAGLQRSDPAGTSVLIVAGGWVDEILAEGVVTDYLKSARITNPDLVLAGVCSGALFFGAAGLLHDRQATTYHPDFDLLKQWCTVIDARIVDDGDVITTGSGWLSGLDLPLYLIERELSNPRLAIELEQRIGHDRRGTVWRAGALSRARR
jgi:transcriptional regulator GlxA family with amidase domain